LQDFDPADIFISGRSNAINIQIMPFTYAHIRAEFYLDQSAALHCGDYGIHGGRGAGNVGVFIELEMPQHFLGFGNARRPCGVAIFNSGLWVSIWWISSVSERLP
jgi:hypothetical protein